MGVIQTLEDWAGRLGERGKHFVSLMGAWNRERLQDGGGELMGVLHLLLDLLQHILHAPELKEGKEKHVCGLP